MKKSLFVIPLLVAIVGCSSTNTSKPLYLGNDYSSTTYSGKQAQRGQEVATAKVKYIREVLIQDDPGAMATTAGAGIGALGVIAISNGIAANPYLQAIGIITGALAGGAVSNQVANNLYQTKGYEFTLQLNDGRLISVSQMDADNIKVGDMVFVTKDSRDGILRVYKRG